MNQLISIISGGKDFQKIQPKGSDDLGNSTNAINALSQLEQQIFDELIEIENEGKFDIWTVNRLELLQKINKAKSGINKIVLKKIKWYLKTLLALNLSNNETINYLKTNLMDLLDNEELEHGRSLESPFLVGFNRDENGKIVPIYGNRIFLSKRNITGGVLFSKESRKEVALIPGVIKQVSEMEIRKTGFWDLLPQDLKSIFESGNILQTTGVDFYDINGTYQKGAFACETQAETLVKIDENIQIGATIKQMYNGISNYMLLYYGEYGNTDNGRTGVLVEMKDGKIEPVKVEIDGVEYIVEIKGCGLRSGGFGEMQSRTWREILSGGVEKDQAIEEFEVLGSILNGDGPKVAGITLFNNTGYEQGQIVRLSPSTIRASYTGNKCYEDIEKPENVEKVLDMYVKGFVEMFFSNPSRIISRSSHSENLLFWGEGKFCWTDYSDQLFLNSNRLPFNAEAGGFLTVKKLLFFIIEMKKEIPGYNEEFRGIFTGNLMKYFKENGIDLLITKNSTDEEITNEIWQKILAYLTFKQKLNFGFYPERIERDFEKERNEFLGKNNSITTFKEQIEKGVIEFKKSLEGLINDTDIELNTEQIQKITEIINYINKGEFYKILSVNFSDSLSNIFTGKLIYIKYYFRLPIDFLSDTILFLESEIDMLENSYNLASEEEKTIIKKGLEFYRLRLKYIKKVNNFELPLEEIFEFMKSFKFGDLGPNIYKPNYKKSGLSV